MSQDDPNNVIDFTRKRKTRTYHTPKFKKPVTSARRRLGSGPGGGSNRFWVVVQTVIFLGVLWLTLRSCQG